MNREAATRTEFVGRFVLSCITHATDGGWFELVGEAGAWRHSLTFASAIMLQAKGPGIGADVDLYAVWKPGDDKPTVRLVWRA